MDFTDMHNIPNAEKLKLVSQLWNEIAASKDPIVVPPEVICEVNRRSAEMIADPSLAIDEAEMWRRVDG